MPRPETRGLIDMLPMIVNARIALTGALAAAAIALTPATPARAWGESEQNFLAGVLTTLAVGAVVNQTRKARGQTPIYSFAPAPTYRPAPSYQPVPTYAPVYQPSVAASAFSEFSPASKRAIQQRLAAYGYYRSGIDGVFGPGTRAALEAYARDSGNSAALQSRDGAVRLMNGLLS
jgi:hypothetical protein